MAKRRRSTLKHFFRPGSMPSADQFGDLVDSTVNQVDDGFNKTPSNGLELAPTGGYDSLLSFFRENQPEQALWRIGYDRDQDRLLFKRERVDDAPLTVLTLTPDGRVGIGCNDPRQSLDVNGNLRAAGRMGVASKGLDVPADGDWHDITQTLSGCHALEVMAGVGRPGTGRYGLLHAIALNTYQPARFLLWPFRPKNPIRTLHACYGSRGNRLRLRWLGQGRDYRLQLGSRCDYGEGVYVRYHLTRLWFDPSMSDSNPPPGAEDQDHG